MSPPGHGPPPSPAPSPEARRFRFAPTPSRPLHVGSALAALWGWSMARLANATFVLRIEDIDRTRVRAEYEPTLLEDLDWLGLDWDEGPDIGGPHAPYRQSERLDRYDDALAVLAARGQVYPCRCSRADIRSAQSAPHLGLADTPRELPYPGTCRPGLDRAPIEAPSDRGGLRLDLGTLPAPFPGVTFTDALAGTVAEDLRETCGDVLLGRPGQPTYQLAVVVDDLAMGMTDIVRGRDLLGSTARQLALAAALGSGPQTGAPGDPPRWPLRFAHHPLLVTPDGRKLSKRDGDAAIATLRSHASPDHLVAALGRAFALFAPSISRASAADFRDALGLALESDIHWRDVAWPPAPSPEPHPHPPAAEAPP